MTLDAETFAALWWPEPWPSPVPPRARKAPDPVKARAWRKAWAQSERGRALQAAASRRYRRRGR